MNQAAIVALEWRAIIQRIDDFHRQGYRRQDLCLYLGRDLRQRLFADCLRYIATRYSDLDPQGEFMGVPMEEADVEGWILKPKGELL